MNKRERDVIVEALRKWDAASWDDRHSWIPGEKLDAIRMIRSLVEKSGAPKLSPPIVRSFSNERTSGTAIPKKKRLVSRKNIEAYKLVHPVCEVCGGEPMADPHHLLAVSLGGHDKADNLIRLCWNHHIGPEGFHTLGMWRWFELVKKHVDTDALDKIIYRLSLGKHVNDLE
jgi:hypothetical protein